MHHSEIRILFGMGILSHLRVLLQVFIYEIITSKNGFVSQAVSDFLDLGLVSEVFSPPSVVNPLTVSFSSKGKGRLVFDLRNFNNFIRKVRSRIRG